MSERTELFADVRQGLQHEWKPGSGWRMSDEGKAANAALNQIEAAVVELVSAAESLSRPGVQTGSVEEMQRGVRMTNAVQALARMAGVGGVFPEIGA